jgi:excisionase family DNA binding protein
MTKLVDITGLAEELPFTVRYIRVLVAEGKIPYYRLGHKTLRFDVEKVQKALERFEIKAVDAK